MHRISLTQGLTRYTDAAAAVVKVVSQDLYRNTSSEGEKEDPFPFFFKNKPCSFSPHLNIFKAVMVIQVAPIANVLAMQKMFKDVLL